jgi:XTP/dITP diphosphohydrolase
VSADQDGAGQTDVPGTALLDLVAIMDRLRTQCPWDARQTHESLVPYLLEETYETLESIERHDLAELRGELGDVLLQVLFHARIAAERTDGTGFTIDDVAKGIADKLVRRHPHVFGEVSVSGADEVKRNWETIKAEERAAAGGGESSALAGVPMGQPALSLAAQLLGRAAAAGAPPELADLTAAADDADRGDRAVDTDDLVGPLGAELFALVVRARAAGLDPELELRRAARLFRDRFKAWEQSASGS